MPETIFKVIAAICDVLQILSYFSNLIDKQENIPAIQVIYKEKNSNNLNLYNSNHETNVLIKIDKYWLYE